MFGERKATYQELRAEVTILEQRIQALTAAHDSVADAVAQELHLCLTQSFWSAVGMTFPTSPRTFKVETTTTLARCKEKK